MPKGYSVVIYRSIKDKDRWAAYAKLVAPAAAVRWATAPSAISASSKAPSCRARIRAPARCPAA